MTRETKIGLVVAGSFLSVMSGLLVMKFRQADQPAKDPNAVAKTELPAPVQVAAATPIEPPAAVTPPASAPSGAPAWPAANVPAPTSAPAVSNEPAPVVPAPVAAPSLDAAPSSLLPAPPVEAPKPIEPPKPAEAPKPVETPIAPPVVKEPEAPKVPEPSPQLNIEPFKPVEPTPPPAPPKKEEPIPEPPKIPTAKLESRPTISPPRQIDPPLNVQPTAAPKPVAPVQPPPSPNDSYLEEEYRVQAGDTFAGISRKFYHDERFAQALRQYNRDYMLASPTMKRDPDNALSTGTITWIPPIRILAKRYPGLTPEMPAMPTGTGTMTSVAAGPRIYRVKEGGESLQEIARRAQLPNDDWTVIHRLNPMLNPNPAVPIPKGTLLRLPAESKVEN